MAAEVDEAAAEAADDALQAAHAVCMRALGSEKHCMEKVTPTGWPKTWANFRRIAKEAQGGATTRVTPLPPANRFISCSRLGPAALRSSRRRGATTASQRRGRRGAAARPTVLEWRGLRLAAWMEETPRRKVRSGAQDRASLNAMGLGSLGLDIGIFCWFPV